MTSEIQKLYECETAAKSLYEAIKLQEAQIAAYSTASAEYIKEWDKYLKNHRDWESKRDEQKKKFAEEKKIWNSCVLWTGVFGHDDWCQADTGFGKQSGAGQHGCTWGQGKGECSRTTEQVDTAMNGWYSENPEPQQPSGGKDGIYAPCSTCSPPTGINILCCSQLTSELNAGKNISLDSVQNCSQEIKNQILLATVPETTTIPATTISSTPAPTTPSPTTPAPTTPAPTTPAPPTVLETSNLITIIIIITVIFGVSISSSLIGLLFS